jgi:hypothetical protein
MRCDNQIFDLRFLIFDLRLEDSTGCRMKFGLMDDWVNDILKNILPNLVKILLIVKS